MSTEKLVEAKLALGEISPELAIKSFIEPKALQTWWGVTHALVEPKSGGLYCLAWQNDHGFGYVSNGLVRSYRQDNHLLLDRMVYMNPEIAILGPMSLDIRIVNDGVTNWLRVIQYGYQEGEDWDWYYEAVRIGWPKALQALKSYLLTEPL